MLTCSKGGGSISASTTSPADSVAEAFDATRPFTVTVPDLIALCALLRLPALPESAVAGAGAPL